jgi:Icc-related predicted phosphoesterase
MKILILADIHMLYPDHVLDELNKQNVQYDLALSLGDNPFPFLRKMQERYRKPMLYVAGNHDDYALHTDEIPGLINVQENPYYQNDEDEFPFCLGFGGCVARTLEDRHRYPSHSQDDCMRWSKTAPKCRILISHTCPQPSHDPENRHAGFVGLRQYIEKNQPEYYFYGHLHKANQYQIGSTKCECIYGWKLSEV